MLGDGVEAGTHRVRDHLRRSVRESLALMRTAGPQTPSIGVPSASLKRSVKWGWAPAGGCGGSPGWWVWVWLGVGWLKR